MAAEDDSATSSSMLVLRSDFDSDVGHHYSGDRQLAPIAPTTLSPSFALPKGWSVKRVIRSDGSRSDKFYVEPETGCKFRSLKEVERYLKGEPCRPRCRKLNINCHVNKPDVRRMTFSGGKMRRLNNEASKQNQLALQAPASAAVTSQFNLPDGWVMEEVPRRHGGIVDKFYYEPGTGRKFRSLVAVERYLEEMKEDRLLSIALAEMNENVPLSRMFKLRNHGKNYGPGKKNIYGEKVKNSFVSPPEKVKWVLASSGGNTWNPFIGESLVPDSVQQQWIKRFMLLINDGNDNAANSEGQS